MPREAALHLPRTIPSSALQHLEWGETAQLAEKILAHIKPLEGKKGNENLIINKFTSSIRTLLAAITKDSVPVPEDQRRQQLEYLNTMLSIVLAEEKTESEEVLGGLRGLRPYQKQLLVKAGIQEKEKLTPHQEQVMQLAGKEEERRYRVDDSHRTKLEALSAYMQQMNAYMDQVDNKAPPIWQNYVKMLIVCTLAFLIASLLGFSVARIFQPIIDNTDATLIEFVLTWLKSFTTSTFETTKVVGIVSGLSAGLFGAYKMHQERTDLAQTKATIRQYAKTVHDIANTDPGITQPRLIQLSQDLSILYDPIAKRFFPDDSLFIYALQVEQRKANVKQAQYGKDFAHSEHAIAVTADTLLSCCGQPIPETTVYESPKVPVPEEHKALATPPTAKIAFKRRNMFEYAEELWQAQPEDKNGPSRGIAILNAMNEWTIGGGATIGSYAMEETLCRSSDTLPALLKHAIDHLEPNESIFDEGTNRAHHKINPHPHAMISENVTFCKRTDFTSAEAKANGFNLDYPDYETLDEKEQFTVHVLGNAAIDLRSATLSRKELKDFGSPESNTIQYRPQIKARIKALFDGIQKFNQNKPDHLKIKRPILSAHGCGAFKQDPNIVGEIFAEVVVEGNHDYLLENIDFAIMGSNYKPFSEAFAAKYHELRQGTGYKPIEGVEAAIPAPQVPSMVR